MALNAHNAATERPVDPKPAQKLLAAAWLTSVPALAQRAEDVAGSKQVPISAIVGRCITLMLGLLEFIVRKTPD
jgi:hypothetical protein